jgi:hypothetical protein
MNRATVPTRGAKCSASTKALRCTPEERTGSEESTMRRSRLGGRWVRAGGMRVVGEMEETMARREMR